MYCFPKNIKIYVEVGMDQPISHTNDLLPRYSVITKTSRFRYLIRCLTYNLNILNQRKDEFAIVVQVTALASLNE